MPASGSTYEAEQTVQSLESLLQQARADVVAIAASGTADSAGAPISRLNASVQDCLTAMRSKLRELELLAQEKDSEQDGQILLGRARALKEESDRLRADLRAANLQAKANAERTAKQERELLLAGGEDAALRRRTLQTKAELAGASETVTESLRRTRQLMTQNLEHGAKTLASMDESNRTLRKATEEYQGHRSLFSATRRLLSKLQSQGILDRVILVLGFLFFMSVCAYVVSKRLGIMRLLKGDTQPLVAVTPPLDAPPTPPGASPHTLTELFDTSLGDRPLDGLPDSSPPSVPDQQPVNDLITMKGGSVEPEAPGEVLSHNNGVGEVREEGVLAGHTEL